MKRFLLIGVMLCITPIYLLAQYKNNKWLMGINGTPALPFGGSKIEFTNNARTIVYESRNIRFGDCFSGISDSNDNWFMYSNGSAICNKNNDTLVNGFGLSPGGLGNWAYLDLPIPASCILFPGDTALNRHYIFHVNLNGSNQPHCLQLYYSIIDPLAANGQGEVISKNNLIINDTLDASNVLPVRHANGRDWWVIVKRFRTNKFYSILVTPDSVYVPNSFFTQANPTYLGGQACFSPDGRYYASFSSGSQLEIYDFDRCTGTLFNYRRKFISYHPAGATSFSPNSRYLYITNIDTLWQLDLQAPDVLASQTFIAKYDGFVDSTFNYNTLFWWHWLAPDGKIYIVSGNQARVLHVINNPDMPGQACDFQQHSVSIPTVNNWTTPTSINLALYQLPGSPCDTLGVGSPKLQNTNSVLKITPNPSDGIFSIEYIPQRVSGMLYIYDIAGKEVYREYVSPYTSIKNLDLGQQLNNGMYAICLVFGNNTLTQKVMIQKH
jgi:hypothetical protein